MATRYRRSNPLGLALLSLLWERDMHPYEMASTLRERHMEETVKLNYGSLYAVVESLRRHELIEVAGEHRAGRLPQRTVYRLTDAGRIELDDWLSDLLSRPAKEYPRFEAGVALVGLLPPEEVVGLLEQRATRLADGISNLRGVMSWLREDKGLPQLAWIELDYRVAVLEAERAWVERFTAAVQAGTVEGFEQWRATHRKREEKRDGDHGGR